MVIKPMTGQDMAEFIGPLVGIRARQDLGALAVGAVSEIALRYDEVNNIEKLTQWLTDNAYEVQLYDGEEWFTIRLLNPEGFDDREYCRRYRAE